LPGCLRPKARSVDRAAQEPGDAGGGEHHGHGRQGAAAFQVVMWGLSGNMAERIPSLA
jgi:hypothetical protein